jgi:Rieske Fe-S protein
MVRRSPHEQPNAGETPAAGDKSSRRSFLDWFLGTSVGALLLAIFFPVVRFLDAPASAEASTGQVEAGSTNDPEFVERGFKIVSFGGEPVIVLRLEQDRFRAFSATCTHLSCIVEYRRDKDVIWCNCHNGAYDLGGKNIAGPPPRPLTPYTVHLVDGATARTVVVSRS